VPGRTSAALIPKPSSRALAIVSVWLLIFALVSPSQAGATAANESDFVARVNATRASVGLPALAVDGQLTSVARSWAGQMRDGVCGEGNNICHAGSLGAGIGHSWQKLGENVGTGPNVADVMAAFIASPGHYANVVDPQFTHIGVGVVWDGTRMYTTHRFMALSAPPPTTTTQAPTTTTQAPSTTAAPATTAPSTSDAVLGAPGPTPSPTTIAPPARPQSTSGSGATSRGTNQTEPTSDDSENELSSNSDVVVDRERRADVLLVALQDVG